jgi:hypothetical protein
MGLYNKNRLIKKIILFKFKFKILIKVTALMFLDKP